MYTCVDTQDICIIAHALLLSLPFFVCSSLSMRAYGHTYTHQIHVYSFTCTHICMLYISTCTHVCIADVSYTRTYTGDYSLREYRIT